MTDRPRDLSAAEREAAKDAAEDRLGKLWGNVSTTEYQAFEIGWDEALAAARLDPRQDDSVIPSSTGLVAVADQRARPGRGCFKHGRADCDDCYCDALAPVAARLPVEDDRLREAAQETLDRASRLWGYKDPDLLAALAPLEVALAAPSPVEADEGAPAAASPGTGDQP